MLSAHSQQSSKQVLTVLYLLTDSQRPQKLTYSYTQIFWVSCDQPMPGSFPFPNQSRTQSNACSRVRLALALGKRNELCNFIGCGEISRCMLCARHSLRDFCGKYAWNKTHEVNGRKQIYRGNLSSLFE